nr:hypothetical protein [Tanacetum cinerariifolium]
ALYTRDCCCSKGNVEDKILVLKPLKNCARCGHPVDGPYCQQCALLRKKLEEDLGPQSFVDKIICDLNKAPGSPHLHTFSLNQFHFFHCKDVLGDGEVCQRCTCTRSGSGLSKGLCLICRNNQNSLNDSPSISANSSQSPPHIDERCYECGDALDGIFCQRCTCKSCGKGAHIRYNCPPKNRHAFYNDDDDDDVDYTIAITPVLSTEEPDNSLSMGDEHIDTIPATESDEVIKSSVEDLVPIPSESKGIPDIMCDVHLVNNPTPLEAKDHFEIVINSNDDYSSSDNDYLYNEKRFPPTDRSDFTHEEFADELAHIISSPEYDCFYFRDLPDPGEWISSLNSEIRKNLSSKTCVNLPVEDDHSPLLVIPENVKTLAKGFCTQVFISSASYWESRIQI